MHKRTNPEDLGRLRLQKRGGAEVVVCFLHEVGKRSEIVPLASVHLALLFYVHRENTVGVITRARCFSRLSIAPNLVPSTWNCRAQTLFRSYSGLSHHQRAANLSRPRRISLNPNSPSQV
jgi:hypothetical protein